VTSPYWPIQISKSICSQNQISDIKEGRIRKAGGKSVLACVPHLGSAGTKIKRKKEKKRYIGSAL